MVFQYYNDNVVDVKGIIILDGQTKLYRQTDLFGHILKTIDESMKFRKLH